MLRFYEDGSVALRDSYTIPDSQWKKIAACATRTGYGCMTAETAEDVYSRLADDAPSGEYVFNDDMAAELRRAFGLTKEDMEKERLAKEVAEEAEEYYGEPIAYSHAGWLTVNGKFLNFSGDGISRDIDHRGVREILDRFDEIELHDEPGSNLAALMCFMDMGNIRLMTYGADISACPNEHQWEPLHRYLRSLGAVVYIDISTASGANIATLDYKIGEFRNIRPDLERFFSEGILPERKAV